MQRLMETLNLVLFQAGDLLCAKLWPDVLIEDRNIVLNGALLRAPFLNITVCEIVDGGRMTFLIKLSLRVISTVHFDLKFPRLFSGSLDGPCGISADIFTALPPFLIAVV